MPQIEPKSENADRIFCSEESDIKLTFSVFEGKDDKESIGVYLKCPKCDNALSEGTVAIDENNELILSGWNCKTHGDIEPYYDRDFDCFIN